MLKEVKEMVIKESDVWKAARRYGGVSCQYGLSSGIYEVILPGEGKQFCIVISETPVLPETVKRIAKSISQSCYRVGTQAGLERVLEKVARGE